MRGRYRYRYRYSPKAFCIDNQPRSSQGKSTRKKANNSIEDPNQKDLFTENRSEASSVGSLTVYTDGACIKNPGGPGAWAFVILDGEEMINESSGTSESTTNNRMEIQAVISALKAIPELTSVTVITDSQYVQLGASNWIRAWRKNNWRTKSRKGIGSSPVKNVDLWQELSRLTDTRYCKFKWVRGHNGDYWNEYCDRLATLGLSKLCEISH